MIQHVTAQQAEMYRSKGRHCDGRIVSIHQPHVRPIVLGKANKNVEFGARLRVSLAGNGLARVDRTCRDAFRESADLKHQVEAYKSRHSEASMPIRSTAPGKTGAFCRPKAFAMPENR